MVTCEQPKWTRKHPTTIGRYWAARRFSEDDTEYTVGLVDVFGATLDELHVRGLDSVAMPLSWLKRFDFWFSTEPVQYPDPPAFRKTRRPAVVP